MVRCMWAATALLLLSSTGVGRADVDALAGAAAPRSLHGNEPAKVEAKAPSENNLFAALKPEHKGEKAEGEHKGGEAERGEGKEEKEAGHGEGKKAGHEEGKEAGSGEEGEGEKEGEEEEEEEGEEEEFTPVDMDAACMLLGGVSFVMAVLSMVNADDDDVRRYAWRVISNTVSIFMAVLFFQGFNVLIISVATTAKWPNWVVVVVQYLHSAIYIMLMLASVAWSSGVFETNLVMGKKTWVWADAMQVSYEREVEIVLVRDAGDGSPSHHEGREVTKSVARDEFGLEVPVELKMMERDSRWRRNKAWSTLLAHLAGFAAIAAGGELQKNHHFASHWFLSLFPVVITTGVMLCLFQGTNVLRSQMRKDAEAKKKKDPSVKNPGTMRAKMVHEIVLEAENDVLSLAISFNLVQSLRFAITGSLPTPEGEDRAPPQRFHSTALFVFGAVFIVLSFVVAGFIKKLEEKGEKEKEEKALKLEKSGNVAEGEEAEEESMLARVLDIMMNTWAMCSAWSLLFAFRICWMLEPRMPFGVATIDGRVLLATFLSLLGFAVVYYLDRVDNMMRASPEKGDQANKAAESAIASVVSAVSVLVGFSWENGFDGAVEAVASKSEGHKQATKFWLGILVCGGLLVPWRRYILKRSLQLEEMQKSRTEAQAKVQQTKAESSARHLAQHVHQEQTKPLLPSHNH